MTTKIIAVINQKGGVGKTTTVINVGASLALQGKKVLLVDLDPQGNMSAGLGIEPQDIADNNAYFALVGQKTLIQCTLKTAVENLSVVPSNNDLAGAEVELVNVARREFRLRDSLTQEILDFDYVFIDCPPSLGLLTLNALCGSTSYLIPLQSEFFAMQGLTNILNTAKLVKTHLNPALEEEGILVTMFDSRSNLSKQVYTELQQFAGNRLFANVIPRRVRLAESTSHGLPGVIYDPTCLGSRSYQAVAEELEARGRGELPKAQASKFVPPDPVDRFGKSNRPSPEPSREV
ncbi:MAG: AAA family ATPase [Bdellovibrionota bacterium]